MQQAPHGPLTSLNAMCVNSNKTLNNFQDKEVASLIENLYSKLKLVLVRKDEQKSASLRSHLARIDGLLERRATR